MLFADYSSAFDAIIPDVLAVRPSNVDFPSQPIVHESEASSLPVHKVCKQALSLFPYLSLPLCFASNELLYREEIQHNVAFCLPTIRPSSFCTGANLRGPLLVSEQLCSSQEGPGATSLPEQTEGEAAGVFLQLHRQLCVARCGFLALQLLCKGSCLASSRCLCRAKSIIKDCSQPGHKLF